MATSQFVTITLQPEYNLAFEVMNNASWKSVSSSRPHAQHMILLVQGALATFGWLPPASGSLLCNRYMSRQHEQIPLFAWAMKYDQEGKSRAIMYSRSKLQHQASYLFLPPPGPECPPQIFQPVHILSMLHWACLEPLAEETSPFCVSHSTVCQIIL